jgi:hypothetical protein
LLTGLSLAAHAVGPGATGAPAGDDPLRLDLPTLGPGSGDAPNAAVVRLLGSLYLAAELEQAGVVAIAELLTQQRDTLSLNSYEAAAKLDDFDTRSHAWYDRASRLALYARLFGIGPNATNDAGTLANRDFVSLLAALCHALVSYASSTREGSGELEAMVRESAEALLENLSSRALANTVLAARRIEDQTRHAVDILRDPAVDALVGARTMQDAIVAILGADAPDVQRLIDCGLAGQKILDWLAGSIAAVYSGASSQPLVSAADPVFQVAEHWLMAAGVNPAMPQAA